MLKTNEHMPKRKEERNRMPRMDGTGPWGMGPCGRGLWHAGWGWRAAPGWRPWFYAAGFSREELLREQKSALEKQLAWIEEELKVIQTEVKE
jgi:hypothetical protein